MGKCRKLQSGLLEATDLLRKERGKERKGKRKRKKEKEKREKL